MKLTYKDASCGMKNTTISRMVVVFKTFLRWAKKNDYYKGNALDNFKPKFKGIDDGDKEIIYLTWDELTDLYNFEFEHTHQANARDVFCFCCFTGLRYSDVSKLKKNDVKNDCISVVTQKTTKPLKIELNKYSRAILEKHKNNGRENALPIIPIKEMNDYLREIGKMMGIDEPCRTVYFIGNERYEEVHPKYELLTSHCGRRTFIVNSLFLGIPAEVIMKWTGHKDYRSMKPYMKIIDELKRESMKKFDQK
jgi:integrase